MYMFPARPTNAWPTYDVIYKHGSLYIGFHLWAEVTHQLIMRTSQLFDIPSPSLHFIATCAPFVANPYPMREQPTEEVRC